MSLTQNLVSGEKILWQGVPGRGLRFRRSDLTQIPFGLLFFGFALFWEYSVLARSGTRNAGPIGDLFPLFGIPFVVVGFYKAVGRFFWDAYLRAHTTYALTNRRALIETTALGKKLVSVTLSDLNQASLEERANGLGTIVLGRDTEIGAGRGRRTNPAPRFEFIADAQRLYKMVEDVRSKSQA